PESYLLHFRLHLLISLDYFRGVRHRLCLRRHLREVPLRRSHFVRRRRIGPRSCTYIRGPSGGTCVWTVRSLPQIRIRGSRPLRLSQVPVRLRSARSTHRRS
ncbi:unnamed protein product, partial [Tenebrio molitor]